MKGRKEAMRVATFLPPQTIIIGGNGLEGKHALTKSSFSREIIKVLRTGIFYHFLTASAFAKRI